MDARQKQRFFAGTYAIVFVVIAVALGVGLNVLMSQQSITYDLTDNKIYTLSSASKNAVAKLPEPVLIKAYISPDMPVPLHTMRQKVEDLLNDYVNASDGKLSYEIISPHPRDKEAERKARKYGIEKVAIGQQSENEVSLRAVFKSVAFVMGDRTEVIKELRSSGRPEFDNFEYEFTKAILNLQNDEGQKVGFLSGFGGPASNREFIPTLEPMFADIYGGLIEISAVDLSKPSPTIDPSIDALVILNVEESVSPKALFVIDQYIQGGGSVGWYQSATGRDLEMVKQIMQKSGGRGPIPDVRKPLDTRLNAFFEKMGLRLNSDIVLDRQRALAMGFVKTEKGPARVSHPASFLLENLDRSLPFVAVAPALVLPASSSISVVESVRARKNLKIFEVAKTEATAVARPTPPQTLNYEKFVQIQPDENPGPVLVAAAISGNIASYYRDSALPEGIDENLLVKNSQKGRVLIVGSGDFFQANPQVGFNNQLAGLGGQFLLSSIEWLAQKTALSEIRGKKVPRIIGEVPKEVQRKIQFANIVAVPALFALIGIIIVNYRRRRRDNFKL